MQRNAQQCRETPNLHNTLSDATKAPDAGEAGKDAKKNLLPWSLAAKNKNCRKYVHLNIKPKNTSSKRIRHI